MTDLVYLQDSYKKTLRTTVQSLTQRGHSSELVLDQTIFYPLSGGQPSDKGEITGPHGTFTVTHVRLQQGLAIHEGSLKGTLAPGDTVECAINWDRRYAHMRVHSAGHILHEAIMEICPGITPVKGEHGDHPYIEYTGTITADKATLIETGANAIVSRHLPIVSTFVTRAELEREVSYVPEHLPRNKPLRIVKIGEYQPIPDGGTQVATTDEVGTIRVTGIENLESTVRVHYAVETTRKTEQADTGTVSAAALTSMILEVQHQSMEQIRSGAIPAAELKLRILGGKSDFSQLTRQLRHIPAQDRQRMGILINEVKSSLEQAIAASEALSQSATADASFDISVPGLLPPSGHLHIVTQAIMEITRIFERIGFTRVRHPEVDWDWYPFESLNMPPDHPARDEWETFFIQYSPAKTQPRRQKIVLTPHTSNGQVREMEKGHLPIRMINIAKCYRRQSDVSHVPMFHQFEGLYVDRNVGIGHLKGVLDYFVKQFFGPERKARIRPFHFQFTEPSFEIDISCDVCGGTGCRLCKEGWLELGGAGMVHPVVLRNGIGAEKSTVYNGFAFGWGVERTYMMKSGTKLDDIRLLYSNDIRFLEQF